MAPSNDAFGILTNIRVRGVWYLESYKLQHTMKIAVMIRKNQLSLFRDQGILGRVLNQKLQSFKSCAMKVVYYYFQYVFRIRNEMYHCFSGFLQFVRQKKSRIVVAKIFKHTTTKRSTYVYQRYQKMLLVTFSKPEQRRISKV